MSWDGYLTSLLNKTTHEGEMTGCLENAAIISLADGSIWTHTPGFGLYGYPFDVPTEDGAGTESVNINEVELFTHIAKNDGESNSKAGIRISNEKYFKVSSDPIAGTIYLKKNGGGACVALAKTCIIFGSWNGGVMTAGAHPQPQNPGLCNEQCEKLANYLKEKGF